MCYHDPMHLTTNATYPHWKANYHWLTPALTGVIANPHPRPRITLTYHVPTTWTSLQTFIMGVRTTAALNWHHKQSCIVTFTTRPNPTPNQPNPQPTNPQPTPNQQGNPACHPHAQRSS